METYRLKNIAILILLLLNAFLLMLLGYQYMQSQQSDADTVVQLRELFESNQLTLSESVDPLQPALTPMALSRSTGTEADMAAALLGGEAVGASQGGGIYSYTAAAGSLQFRAGGSFDSTQLSRPVEDIAAFVRSFCDDFGYQDVDLQLSGGSGTATAKTATSRTAIPARARFFFFAFISSPPYDSSARNLPKSPVAISTPMATKKPPLTRLITR